MTKIKKHQIWWNSISEKEKSRLCWKHYTMSVQKVYDYEVEFIHFFENIEKI